MYRRAATWVVGGLPPLPAYESWIHLTKIKGFQLTDGD